MNSYHQGGNSKFFGNPKVDSTSSFEWSDWVPDRATIGLFAAVTAGLTLLGCSGYYIATRYARKSNEKNTQSNKRIKQVVNADDGWYDEIPPPDFQEDYSQLVQKMKDTS